MPGPVLSHELFRLNSDMSQEREHLIQNLRRMLRFFDTQILDNNDKDRLSELLKLLSDSRDPETFLEVRDKVRKTKRDIQNRLRDRLIFLPSHYQSSI